MCGQSRGHLHKQPFSLSGPTDVVGRAVQVSLKGSWHQQQDGSLMILRTLELKSLRETWPITCFERREPKLIFR